MAERTMGYCPRCGMNISTKMTHGVGAMGRGSSRMSQEEAGSAHLGTEAFELKRGRTSFKNLTAEASRNLLVNKIQQQLEKKFGNKVDSLAKELVDFMIEEKDMKRKFWKEKMDMESDVYKAFSDLFAA